MSEIARDEIGFSEDVSLEKILRTAVIILETIERLEQEGLSGYVHDEPDLRHALLTYDGKQYVHAQTRREGDGTVVVVFGSRDLNNEYDAILATIEADGRSTFKTGSYLTE